MSRMLTRAAARALSSSSKFKVVDNVAKQQFVVEIKQEKAVIEYEKKGKNILLKNTDVPPAFQGKGIGKLLAEYAFNVAKAEQLDVTCNCHFLADYYSKNIKKYKDLKVKVVTE